jgi:THAP4-like, heme-binding beta-barrel domain
VDPLVDPPLHPDLAPLGLLLGTWVGEGRGEYPTIEPFSYGEEIRLWHVGKPWLAYAQRTWNLDDGRGLHAETGYWRPRSERRVEVVMAQPSGLVEVLEGSIDGTTIALNTTLVGRTSTAKEVTAVTRRFEVQGDLLTYRMSMAAVGQPVQHHLAARLRRA